LHNRALRERGDATQAEHVWLLLVDCPKNRMPPHITDQQIQAQRFEEHLNEPRAIRTADGL
jgi:hypothetical protein